MKTGTCQEPPMDRTARDTQTLSDYERQQKKLATKLLHTGFIWGGSIQSQWTTCGKPGCACSHAPRRTVEQWRASCTPQRLRY
jgi:hypothetical protein